MLPLDLAALNRTAIDTQELTVEAAATGNVEAIRHAVSVAP